MRRLVLSCCVLVLVVTAAACGDDDDGSGSGTSTTTTTARAGNALEGTSWRLADPTALAADAGDAVATARFVKGTVSGTSGCNTYQGPYTVRGDRLTIGPDIATTAMACGPGPTALEAAYLDGLRRTATWAVEDDELRLADSDGNTLLTFEAAGGADEIAGGWTVTGLYTGQAIESVREGATLTADFEDGSVTGNSGCNTYRATYEVDGTSIEIEPAISTMRACEDEALNTQEQQYLAALALARTFSVEGDQLTLTREDGGIAVTFERR
jgi:heat shock protein HslJ